jgi:hypothetical protein
MATQLGRDQLAEARYQYDQTMATAKPVVDAQVGLMNQSKVQGDDYYNYMKQYRPSELKLLNDANDPSVVAADAAERAAITGGDASVYAANQADIDAGVNRAVADARTGFSNSANMLAREGMRYGMTPAALSGTAGGLTADQASAQAAAANGTRTAGIADARNRMNTTRNMRIQDNSTNWARRMDAVGLAKGLVGASQGAYGQAIGAGNAAVGNTMAPGQALIGANQGAAGTIMAGQGQRINGLSSALNAKSQGSGGSEFGSLAGSALGAWASTGFAS